MSTAILNKIPLITLAFLLVSATPLMAQVYNIVYKDGNVTYTDRPPADGSPPIELRPISVIEAPTYETAPAAAKEGEDSKEMSLSYLRKNYKDFAIVSPQQEQSVWRPDGPIPVTWNTQYALQDGMQVTIFLDGKKHSTTTSRDCICLFKNHDEHRPSERQDPSAGACS